MKIQGNIVDIHKKKIFPGEVITSGETIIAINKLVDQNFSNYILPGFIDSHIHIESSMLVPSEFAKAARKWGTIACVCDPHEIANVLGEKGINFMIEDGKKADFHFFFGVPANVPATPLEHNGAIIDVQTTKKLLKRDDIYFLAEYMNYPSVINREKDAVEKINFAKSLNKPIDGHAPGLMNEELEKYASAGITTDHEAFTYEEGLQKIQNNMKILIREGSAAKNFSTLIPLIKEFPEKLMFCSDDKHPDGLISGHINLLVKKAIELGYDLYDVLRVASKNPVEHYNLPIGLLRINDPADFIVVDSLEDFNIEKIFIKGKKISPKNTKKFPNIISSNVNNFRINQISIDQLKCFPESNKMRVIEVVPNQLVTKETIVKPFISGKNVISDIDNDVLKIVVLNRYQQTNPAIGFIKGLGLKDGALATSVSHDSHNIIAVGVNDDLICKAINNIIKQKGGMIALSENFMANLPLPVAGLMSKYSAEETANRYNIIKQITKSFKTKVEEPFMTLSFMALLVIPDLKIGDFGLFDVNSFKRTNLFLS